MPELIIQLADLQRNVGQAGILIIFAALIAFCVVCFERFPPEPPPRRRGGSYGDDFFR